MAIRSTSAVQTHDTNHRDPKMIFSHSGRVITLTCLALLSVGSTGCNVTSGFARTLNKSECCEDFLVGYRNRAMAEKAWHCQKHLFGGHPYRRDFKAGFIAGYLDVADGGNGCIPCIAPREYWGWKYQSAQGQHAVNAWFEAYPLGVKAAEQDGVGHWQQIQMSNSCGVTPIPSGALAPMGAQPVPSDPFYPDQRMVPEMVEEGMEMQFDPGVEAIAPPLPDSAGNVEPSRSGAGTLADQGTEFRVDFGNDDDDLVSRFDVALRPPTAPGTSATPVTSPSEPTAPVELSAPIKTTGDADVSPAVEAASNELPFSFK